LQPASDVRATDTTSILKQLKKNVVIGSSIDPKNGDRGPFGIAVVPGKKTLQKGQLLVCNIENAKGEPGNGTTIELLDSKPGSSPATFARSAALAGCDGITIDSLNTVFATAYTAKDLAMLSSKGAVKKQYSGHYIHVPFGNVFAMQGRHYANARRQILDTKIVDKNKTAGVFGLAAIGTGDSDTEIYYTDTNTNDVEQLER
jgi:hypothetical protein